MVTVMASWRYVLAGGEVGFLIHSCLTYKLTFV